VVTKAHIDTHFLSKFYYIREWNKYLNTFDFIFHRMRGNTTMTCKTTQFDVLPRKDTKWEKNQSKLTIQLEKEGFWELWKLFCSHTILMIEILKKLEQPSAFPARIEKLKTPQENAVFPDIEQEKQWLEVEIKQVCNSLKKQAKFRNLPGRIYSSAIHQILKMLKSWLENQWELLQRISGKKRFLAVVEADAVLAEVSAFSWEAICTEATAVLTQTQEEISKKMDGEAANNSKQLLKALLKKYDLSTDILTCRAIIHLLRNNFKVQHKQEKPEKIQEWLEGKRIELERLEKRVPNLPRSRNLFPEQFYDSALEDLIYYPLAEISIPEKQRQLFYFDVLVLLLIIHSNFPQRNPQMLYYLLQQVRTNIENSNSQFFDWYESIPDKISQFSRIPKSLPYPIYFGGNDVRGWKLNKENRVCFKLNGLGNYLFEVRCHRRQLGLVKYFLEDWQTISQKENKGKYSGGLMLLRSAELLVEPKSSRQDKVQPQANDRKAVLAGYKLSLHCSFDTDYLTKQGLEQVRQRKIEQKLKKLNQKKADLAKQQEKLNQLEQEMQQEQCSTSTKGKKHKFQSIKQIEKLKQSIQKLHTEIQSELEQPNPKLKSLQQSKLFNRPDHPLYKGVANLFIGVSLDLDQYLVVTVVDAMRQKVLTKRNVKQILGKHYHLLQRLRFLKQEHSRQRQKDQKAGRHNRLSEKGLGQQVAYAIANGLITLAQEYKVSTIVLPKSKDWREHLYSRLVAKAKIKCKGIKKAMANYTKEHGKKLHQWDYNRLSQAIEVKAKTTGIVVLFEKANFQADIFEQATQRAISAYDYSQSRNTQDRSKI